MRAAQKAGAKTSCSKRQPALTSGRGHHGKPRRRNAPNPHLKTHSDGLPSVPGRQHPQTVRPFSCNTRTRARARTHTHLNPIFGHRFVFLCNAIRCPKVLAEISNALDARALNALLRGGAGNACYCPWQRTQAPEVHALLPILRKRIRSGQAAQESGGSISPPHRRGNKGPQLGQTVAKPLGPTDAQHLCLDWETEGNDKRNPVGGVQIPQPMTCGALPLV